jgi:hypothetical protein
MKGFHYTTCPLFPGPDYKATFMSECFELVYHGGGGFSWSEVWNMPVQYRRYNLRKINEFLKNVENARNESESKVTESTDIKKISLPSHITNLPQQKPTFVSNVKSKK